MIYLALMIIFFAFHAVRWVRVRPFESSLLQTEPTPGRPDDPLVSFLVPVWNGAQDIPNFVHTFHALAYPRKELILCAGGNDNSFEVAQRYEGECVKVLEQCQGEGKQAALARSFALSRGDLIYLTDIDCRLDSDSFAKVLRPILEGDESVVTGSSIPVETQRSVGAVLIHWATVRKVAGFQPRYIDGLLGRNCVATREAVQAIDGFRFDAPTGTDYRMAQELRKRGYRIWFEPRSEVKTLFAWPLASYIRKRARWLRNVILHAERPRQKAEFRGALIILATPFGLLLLVGLSLLSTWLLPAFLSLLLVLHGGLNRLHYAREMLPTEYIKPKLASGSLLNLFGTLGAGLYATTTLLVPALRRQW